MMFVMHARTTHPAIIEIAEAKSVEQWSIGQTAFQHSIKP